jgi:hypothetical protein
MTASKRQCRRRTVCRMTPSEGQTSIRRTTKKRTSLTGRSTSCRCGRCCQAIQRFTVRSSHRVLSHYRFDFLLGLCLVFQQCVFDFFVGVAKIYYVCVINFVAKEQHTLKTRKAPNSNKEDGYARWAKNGSTSAPCSEVGMGHYELVIC